MAAMLCLFVSIPSLLTVFLCSVLSWPFPAWGCFVISSMFYFFSLFGLSLKLHVKYLGPVDLLTRVSIRTLRDSV